MLLMRFFQDTELICQKKEGEETGIQIAREIIAKTTDFC